MSAKLSDVARLAEVSTATVSRVLNKSGYVSQKSREKVLLAVEELEYSPSRVASYLASRKLTFNIGIVAGKRLFRILSDKSDQFYTIVLNGIEAFFRSNNMRGELIPIDEFSNDFDGYLMIGGEIKENDVRSVKSRGKPVVLIDQYLAGVKVDCVVSDGYDGAIYGIRKLLSKGLKKIVNIHGPLSHFGFKDRYDGYVSAMESAGLLPKAFEFDEENDNMSPIIDLLLSRYGLPDAVFGCNDTAAIRALEELQARGIRIPEEVSIIGFDDIVSSSATSPSLTTFKIFKQEMGVVASRRLQSLLIGNEPHPTKISLFTEFIQRESTS
ncbi:MAG: LacI family transcriptional regulator [Thermotogaceae bacterium]|uniref:LacI family DNA-binding transcriptional regulator n=1 Tax=Mesotoga sp. TaxID=2053577 RepID=UPI00168FAA36|nr:LacI family DNA-binding transcriptional regulator [Mesotoga sp.]MDI9368701.1 LacI family DNA-binding transcriptional regulator [Thermotogota bacterium]NLT45932.1 LacI family transcriptional regulator [Thermotogaceae bacterium]MDD3680393.1 LacI family DNA-binding transcriptional regulator [Mesotoga sp.]MDD4207261.1 LacI family DNA-binding transcriptional regulator [Mesotoga sp.]MDD4825319.1 LacI family DNA-binding transcriptional regulator [Mesotoga sp.]